MYKHSSPSNPYVDLDPHALSDQPTVADGDPLSDEYASPHSHTNPFAYSPSPTTSQRRAGPLYRHQPGRAIDVRL